MAAWLGARKQAVSLPYHPPLSFSPIFSLHSEHMPRCTLSSTDLHLLAPSHPLMVLPWWFIRETNIKTGWKEKISHIKQKSKNKWENKKKEPTSDQPGDCQGRWNQEMKNNNTTKDGKITPKPPILKFLSRHDSWTTHHSLPLTYFHRDRPHCSIYHLFSESTMHTWPH